MAAVLIVEDDLLMRRRFVRAVNEHPQLNLLGEAGCCRDARALLLQKPDLLLVDLGLPDGNGTSLIRQLKSIHPAAEAMVVSVFAEEEKVVGAIRSGASGYLLKDMLLEEIGDAMIDVLQGGSPISPSIARYILKAVGQSEGEQKSESGAQVMLTAREDRSAQPDCARISA